MDFTTANAAEGDNLTQSASNAPRAGEGRRSMSAGLTPATCAGIIVLVALLILVALRMGFAGALGD